MSKLIFILETFHPNLRSTFFKNKNYCSYLAYSEYAIKNENTNHGLFGRVSQFTNIKDMESVDKITKHITELLENKVPIYRGLISLNEYDASRLGYLKQEKWQELLENKLPSIARKLNIKYEDIQYIGAVHLEEGHPHFQFMLWSKSREKSNYYINYKLKNELRLEFTNAVFREDLLPIYQEKDKSKKEIISENEILNKLKLISKDKMFLDTITRFEKNFYQNKIMKQTLKNEDVRKIVSSLLELKDGLKETKGSIKYEYLKKYPDIIKKIDNISREIISLSYECQKQIDNYIKAKQKIVEFQYSNKMKIEKEKNKVKEKAEKEIIKLIGNKILDFERILLNNESNKNEYFYINKTRDHINYIFNFLCSLSNREESNYRILEIKYKKQLSKQVKKEIAKEKSNKSSFNWESER